MKNTQPIFPISLEQLKTNPAIREHWPQVSRLITGYLLTLMHTNGLQGKNANTAEHAVGAGYAASMILEHFMQLTSEPVEAPKRAPITQLNRFSTDTPEPKTPEK